MGERYAGGASGDRCGFVDAGVLGIVVLRGRQGLIGRFSPQAREKWVGGEVVISGGDNV